MVASGTKGQCSSYNVFMNFVSASGDAAGILSRECYENWVATRKSTLKQPEESFRRVLTAHVCGLIGRKPFPADIEASLLRCLRKKQIWPCFKATDVTIGIKGFRKTGFHESRRGIFGANAASSTLSPRNRQSNASYVNVPSNVMLNPNLLASTNMASRRSSLCGSAAEGASHGSRGRNSMVSCSSHDTEIDSTNPVDHLEYSADRLQETDFEKQVESADVIGGKRRMDSLDPLHIFNGSGPMFSTLGFPSLSVPKRLKTDPTTPRPASLGVENFPLTSGLYNLPNVKPGFVWTGFQDVQVPSENNTHAQSWPLA